MFKTVFETMFKVMFARTVNVASSYGPGKHFFVVYVNGGGQMDIWVVFSAKGGRLNVLAVLTNTQDGLGVWFG